MWKNLSGEVLIFSMVCECGRGILSSCAVIFLDKNLASGAEQYPISHPEQGPMFTAVRHEAIEEEPSNNMKKYGC